MGKGKKAQPKFLSEKLRLVRRHLNFTQEQMVRYVVPETEDAASDRAAISDYESGRRAPSPLEVFHYAKTVCDLTDYKNFTSDDLIDDARPLPFSTELHERIISDDETKTIASSGEESKIVSGRGEVDSPAEIRRDCEPGKTTFSSLEEMQQNILDNNLAGLENYEQDEPEIDYQRSFYFSSEFLEKFDNFGMRLLLAAPTRLREHYCDASLSIEIAVAAALRDLERMDRANAPSVVVECLREHAAEHFEN